MSTLLSVCIPTYNRARYLKENIDIILAQLTDDLLDKVEICIGNNASTDETHQMMQELIAANPKVLFRYVVHEKNMGADWNFNFCMNMARGRYSWLLGDDDGLADGALKRIVEIIDENPEISVFLFNRINCDINLKEQNQQRFFRDDISRYEVDFSNKLEEKYYYSQCKSLAGLLSFISAVVYDTRAVTEQKFDEAFIGSAYAHLFYWYTYLKQGRKLLYLDEYLIKCRHGLPSWGQGFKRIMIDLDGFFFIKEKLFKNDPAGHELIAVLKPQWRLHQILTIYCEITPQQWNEVLKPALYKIGWEDDELSFIENMGNTPNLYRSRFITKARKAWSNIKSLGNAKA